METQGIARIGRDQYTTQIEISGHRITADEPPRVGGQNRGPAPYDLVLAGLGACTAITLRMYADRKQWPLESVEVGLRLARHADGTISVERTLKAIGLDEAQQQRLAEIAEKTPVTLTLKHGLPIHTTLVRD
jgi:putative redox protein